MNRPGAGVCAGGGKVSGLRASAVDHRDRVDLDQVLGSGQRLYPDYRVGWLVIAEQRLPGLFGRWQVRGPVVNDIDRDLGDLPGARIAGSEGAAEISEHLAGLGLPGRRG